MKITLALQATVLLLGFAATGSALAFDGTAGNHRRGRAMFAQRGCVACHAVDGKTASLGPDLSQPENGKRLTRAEMLESIAEPSKRIRKGYESYAIVLASGKVLTGRIAERNDASITLLVPTQTRVIETVVIPVEEVDDIVQQPISPMPKDLLKGLPDARIADLLAYLDAVSDPDFVEPAVATIPEKQPGVLREPEESDATFHSPEESMKRIHLAPGYRLELVAAEPMIEEPVLCVWDGNSRMYVAEMRTYMQDADGTDEDLPRSRVSLLEDTDGDGRMDKVTRFVDDLVLPRMILPLDDRIIVNETYTSNYVAYRDTDGDGVADEKTMLYEGGPAGGNLEHQDSGMLWGVDNWIYTARNGSQRHRFVGGEWTTDPIHGENGQWGLAMDDIGRMFLSAAGGEKPAYGFQQLPIYGPLQLPGEREPDFEAVFPIVRMVDVQGGLGRVDKVRGGLNRFTGCAGQSVYRGDRLPEEMRGDYILPEPVGRLVRRARITTIEGKYVLSNAYENSEFIASTDKNFRPLWSATGPDGCLYIVDMYRGIIQEGNWTRKGSYLRGVIDREGLARNIGRGRIYRVVHESTERDTPPRMLEQSTAELVAHLAHPNGWWRDTAQKLIVLRGDRTVVPLLRTLAASGESPLGRMHALWTLDGLGVATRATVVEALGDPDPRVRQAGLRIGEPLIAEDADLVQAYGEAGYDDDISVVVQAINSLRFAKTAAARSLLTQIAAVHPENDLVIASVRSSLSGRGGPKFANFDAHTLEKMKLGYQAYTTVCIRCHGPDGNGAISSDGLQLAPPLAKSPRLLGPPDLAARILLHGLTGPIDGKKYPGAMESMKRQDDEWIASALTYTRNSFGNAAPPISREEVARVRRATAAREDPYTIEDFAAYTAVPPEVVRSWAFTASSGNDPQRAVDGDPETRFDTGGAQQPGQWLQFDMGEPFELTSLVLDARGSDGDFPRRYDVRLSDDGETWTEPVATGSGAGAVTTIPLSAGAVARFVRIVQTGELKGTYWSIHELGVFGRATGGAVPEIAAVIGDPPGDAHEREQWELGHTIYTQSCLACHGRTGAGRVDADLRPLAPPLDRRSAVVASREAVVGVVVRGLKSETANCPALVAEQPDAARVAAVTTFLRRTLHGDLEEISPDQARAILATSGNRGPYTREELATFVPISAGEMASWKLTASHGAKDVSKAIDGDPGSRYTTHASMAPGMWFAFDMQRVHAIRSVVLDTTKSAGDYPRGYAVFVANDDDDWGDPILEGAATTPITELTFPAGTRARRVKIEQTGSHGLYWSIHELRVFGSVPGEDPPAATGE